MCVYFGIEFALLNAGCECMSGKFDQAISHLQKCRETEEYQRKKDEYEEQVKRDALEASGGVFIHMCV